MKYLKTFEKSDWIFLDFDPEYMTYDTKYDERIIINLINFNASYMGSNISRLKNLLVGNIVGFRGQKIDRTGRPLSKKYINKKDYIIGVSLMSSFTNYGKYVYEFKTNNHFFDDEQIWKIDNNYPVIIYTGEKESRKYNL